MYVLEHLPSQQNSNSQLWCCRLVPSVPLGCWCWRLHNWEMITGVVVFNPPQGMGCDKGIGRKMQRGSRRWREEGRDQNWHRWRMMLFLKGLVFLGLPVLHVHRWKIVSWVKLPRDRTVISVNDNNMFIVLLCLFGWRDRIVIKCGPVFCLYDLETFIRIVQ